MSDEPTPAGAGKKTMLLKLLKIFGIFMGVLIAGFGTAGYLSSGWEGVWNGLTWVLIIGLLLLPGFALLISARFWGDYTGRWGAAQYKEQLEGKPDDGKNRDW